MNSEYPDMFHLVQLVDQAGDMVIIHHQWVATRQDHFIDFPVLLQIVHDGTGRVKIDHRFGIGEVPPEAITTMDRTGRSQG